MNETLIFTSNDEKCKAVATLSNEHQSHSYEYKVFVDFYLEDKQLAYASTQTSLPYDWINRILIDNNFRELYLDIGEWNMPIPYQAKNGVNIQCKKQIKDFYSGRQHLKLERLHTFGKDDLITFTTNELYQCVDSDILKQALISFVDNHLVDDCLRWYLRGLKIEDAVEKIKLETNKSK